MNKMFKMVSDFLGIKAFSEKEGKKILTEEQKTKLEENFGSEFVSMFEGKLSDAEQADANKALQKQVATLKTQITEATTAFENLQTATAEQKDQYEAKIIKLQTAIAKLSDDDEPKPIPTPGRANSQQLDHSVALFGAVDSSFMVLEGRPYNQRAAQALAAKQGIQISASTSTDFSKLAEDLGDYYRTRRETIHSMVRELPSVEKVFPLHSGYQDQEVLLNAFLGEFSQAFQDKFTPKGKYEIEPEIIKMFDVKFDHKFSKLKALEKQWIGFINKEGSDAIKMSFIEYLLAETVKKLHNEREQRRIKGHFIKPEEGVAGPFINAANGLLTFIKQKINGLQIKPFQLGEWTPVNIVEYVFNASMMIPQDVRDTGSLVVYGSSDAKIWYEKNFENLYSRNTDYTGTDDKVKFLNSIRFVSVPNMGGSKRLIWSVEGNIALFEDRPNEMTQFNFEQEDRTLKVWSDWRESVWAFVVGKKWAKAEEMDYEHQLIWCNDVDEPSDYFLEVAPNDITPSVALHTSIKTGVNSQVTKITDIKDMKVGDKVIVKCGSNNPFNSEISKYAKFSKMTASWKPAMGDTITLFKRAEGDIIDLARTTVASKAVALEFNASTIDASSGNEFVTDANTEATTISTIENATPGLTYVIYGGSNANASKITNGGEFSLTSVMELTKGKFIKLYARTTTDFVELARG